MISEKDINDWGSGLPKVDSELKGCPCCGSENVGSLGAGYSVICYSCGLRTMDMLTKGEAKLAWNRRAGSNMVNSVITNNGVAVSFNAQFDSMRLQKSFIKGSMP